MQIVTLHLVFLLISYLPYPRAYTPDGYIGCFLDWNNRILNGKYRKSNTNSGDECIQYCTLDGYRFAGTESTDECYCGYKMRIRKEIKGCTRVCPGNHAEKCGGHLRISVYDTTKRETTSAQTSSSSATKSTSSTTTTTLKTTQLFTSTTATTKSLYRKSTDAPAKSTVAMYVLLPLGIIIAIVIIAVFLTRRCQRMKGKVQDIAIHDTGTVPNIYANLSVPQCNELDQGYEMDVLDKEGKGTEKHDMEDYNITKLKPMNRAILENSYDHLVNPTSYVDTTYSHLPTTHQINAHLTVHETNAPTEKDYGQYDASGCSENNENTYNTLKLRTNQRENLGNRTDQCLLYDHTDTGHTYTADTDNYSHINTSPLQNANCEDSCVLAENLYNEEEYATVEESIQNSR